MLCAISGEAPQHPVASRKSGNVYEKRLIEQYIRENGTDPVNGEELTADDLLDLQQPRTVKPRPPTQTSIPALLASFQNEWDALILETYQLKQQLSETRQELSTALYYNDAAEKVIARLQKERDAARDALSRVTVSSSANGVNGDAMQVDGPALSDAVISRIEQTQQQLSSTRRKRPVPQDWATSEVIQSFDASEAAGTIAPPPSFVAVDEAGELALIGGANGQVTVQTTSQGKAEYNLDAGGDVLTGTWWGSRAVIGTSSGDIKIFEQTKEVGKLSKHAGAVTAVSLHPCRDILASIGADKSFVLYDLQTLAPLTQQYVGKELSSAAFHPDGHLLAIGTAQGEIKLFDVKTLENIHTFTSSMPSAVLSIAFSENGTWLATVNKNSTSVTVWDLRKTAELKTFEIGAPIQHAQWDYTGQYLAVAGPSCVAVQQYTKASKSWSEPLRKAADAAFVGWGSKAQSLITVGSQGGVVVFSSS
ncbi:Pre-mRNA-processing factor 19-like protein [Elsinoe fawcettii]|nr:Pre-mRNA-processing factor 19-like protein [Elsinoe fawcettii]